MTRIVRARLLSFVDSPRRAGADSYSYTLDGALWLDKGKIVEVGEAKDILSRAPATPSSTTIPKSWFSRALSTLTFTIPKLAWWVHTAPNF